MLKNATFSVIAVTVFLVLYCILLQIESTQSFAIGMFVVSPLLVVWMVYTVLKHGAYRGRELATDEEYGYQDK